MTAGARGRVSATREPPRPFAYLSSPQRAALGVLRGGMARRPCRGDVIELRVARRPILFASIETPRPREPAGSARRGSGANFIGRVRPSLKRPPKTPDRAYPLVKNQEYANAYDWEHRSG